MKLSSLALLFETISCLKLRNVITKESEKEDASPHAGGEVKGGRPWWMTPEPDCSTVEWEANATDTPCWLLGTCKDNELQEGIGVSGDKSNTRGNIHWKGRLLQPTSLDELVQVIKNNSKFVIPGAGHSQGGTLAPGQNDAILLSLWKGFRHVKLDSCRLEITVQPGVAHFDIASTLNLHKVSMPTWLYDKGFSIIGLVSSNAIGLGAGQTNAAISEYVQSMKVVNGKGEVKNYRKDGHEGRAWVSAVGELGVIVELTMDVVPDFYDVQSCNNYASLEEATQALDLTNANFPGTYLPWNDAHGTNFLYPAIDVCGSLNRSFVRAGPPWGYDKECSNPTAVHVDFDPAMRAMKIMRHFPVQQASLVNMGAQLQKNPELLKKSYPQILKQFSKFMLPDFPFHPEKGAISCMQSSQLMGDQSQWNLPEFQPIWMELFFPPSGILHFQAKMRQTMNEVIAESPWIWAMWARKSVCPPPRPYLAQGTEDSIRAVILGFGAGFEKPGSTKDKTVVHNYFKRLACNMQCEAPIVPITSYHLGCYFPMDLMDAADIEFPSLSNLQDFFDVENKEDPENKFETLVGNAYRSKISNMLSNRTGTLCSSLCTTFGDPNSPI